jgi:hypothetical protein
MLFTVLRGSSGDDWVRGRSGRLERDETGSSWIARRQNRGLSVTEPGNPPLVLTPGFPVQIGDGLQIGYVDKRPPRAGLLDRFAGRSRPVGPAPSETEDPSAGTLV